MSELTTKQTLWLAKQLGLDADMPFGETNSIYVGKSSTIFDPEANTPEGAYWREKIVEWLAKEHGINITFEEDAWYAEDAEFGVDARTSSPLRSKAIFAAVKWVWENRDE